MRSQRRARAPALAAGITVTCVLLLAAVGAAGAAVSGAFDTVRATGRAVAEVTGGKDDGDAGTAVSPWRHAAVDAVFFYGGFYCIAANGRRTDRLLLTLRELEVAESRATRIVGPFSTAVQARSGCR